MRIKISRKEAKESAYWLRLNHETNDLANTNEVQALMQEATELTKILSSIVEKSKRFVNVGRKVTCLQFEYCNLVFIWNLGFGF